ncbi:hypothetical protein HUJ04_006585 [Dendroctonus ponderosae]|nr:hypothetical protein HUJ04_006585 [Dendroctonus ponderosae]KAH1005643.1 hypothetical protein HUJ04_006585 [Dendroctonus ponderosae]
MHFKAGAAVALIVLSLGRCLLHTLIVFSFLASFCICDISLTVNSHDVGLKLNESETFLILTGSNFTSVNDTLHIIIQHTDIVSINLTSIELNWLGPNESVPIDIKALGLGRTDIYSNTSNTLTNVDEVYFRVTVHREPWLDIFSTTIGWIYFLAWSVSFYPQVYINWKRRSVIGLNFDFLALNIVGFILYSIFNLGLYYIPEIKKEYSERYPRGLNPVQVNDIFFAVHAVILTSVTIGQCVLYERAEQRKFEISISLLGFFGVFIAISIVLSGCDVIHWIDFLYYCSYVKLTITLIKYIPQAFMNYRRQSTSGWSIGNILLDFTGGTLSMLQMILNAYNYDDWASIFGDPTKFGLGLFSVAFDIFFMIQHYVLYKHSKYEEN